MKSPLDGHNTDTPMCPSTTELIQFLQGRVNTSQLDRIAEHITQCSPCCAQLELLSTNTAAGLPSTLKPYLDEPIHLGALEEMPKTLRGTARLASVPERLGRYEVLSVLGQGSFGCVYLCEDPVLKRKVAVKVAQRRMFETIAQVNNFIQEARHAASLDHPGIVPIHDVIEDQEFGTLIVMKWIDGQTLKQTMKRQPFDLVNAVRLLISVARAVHHAHEHGLVHRDLKPSNILIDQDGAPYVVDFGLGVDVERDTENIERAGTPQYMAPEQIDGTRAKIDRATDIWALGVLLAELLTGTRPFFQGPRAELYHRILTVEPEIDARLPAELHSIIQLCLKKRVEERLVSADLLATQLSDWLTKSGHGVSPRRPSWPILGSAFLGFAVLLWSLNWALSTKNSPTTNDTDLANSASTKGASDSTPGVSPVLPPTTVSNEPTAGNVGVALEQATAILEQAKRAELKVAQITYAHQMKVAFDCWKDRDVVRTKEILNHLIPKDGAPDVRGCEWSYLNHQLDRPHRWLRFLGLEPQCVRYSPDGRFIAIGGPLMVQVVDAKTLNTAYVIPALDSEFRALAFSADGKLLAATGHNGFVYVWSTATRKLVQKWATNQETGWAVAFSADGQNVIASAANATTRMWSITGGELIRELSNAGGFRSALAVSSDGKFVATSAKLGDNQNGLGIWEMPTGRWLWRENSESVRGLDLTTDNRFMAAALGENVSMFELTDLAQSPRLLWTQRNWAGTRSLRISQDKRRLVVAGDQGELHLFYLTPQWWADLSRLPESMTWMGHDGSARSIDLSPDGDTIVSSGVDGVVRLWSVPDIGTLPLPSSSIYRGSTGDAVFMPQEWKTSGKLSTDGLLVVADNDGIKIWDSETQEVREWIHQNAKAAQPHARYAVAVSKSGRIVTVRDDDTIEIWDRDSSTDHLQQPSWTISNYGGPKLALSGDGNWLVVNDYANEQYLVFDLKSKAEPWSIGGWGPGAARFLGTESKVILVRNGRLDCWDVKLRETVLSYPTEVLQQGVFALSPSQNFVAIAQQNRSIIICETATGRVLQTLVGDEDKISALVFLADEQTLISQGTHSSGSRMKCRQIATGEVLGTLPHVGFEPNECDLSPDGHTIMSRHARRRPTVEAPSLIELRPGFGKRR